MALPRRRLPPLEGDRRHGPPPGHRAPRRPGRGPGLPPHAPPGRGCLLHGSFPRAHLVGLRLEDPLPPRRDLRAPGGGAVRAPGAMVPPARRRGPRALGHPAPLPPVGPGPRRVDLRRGAPGGLRSGPPPGRLARARPDPRALAEPARHHGGERGGPLHKPLRLAAAPLPPARLRELPGPGLPPHRGVVPYALHGHVRRLLGGAPRDPGRGLPSAPEVHVVRGAPRGGAGRPRPLLGPLRRLRRRRPRGTGGLPALNRGPLRAPAPLGSRRRRVVRGGPPRGPGPVGPARRRPLGEVSRARDGHPPQGASRR